MRLSFACGFALNLLSGCTSAPTPAPSKPEPPMASSRPTSTAVPTAAPSGFATPAAEPSERDQVEAKIRKWLDAQSDIALSLPTDITLTYDKKVSAFLFQGGGWGVSFAFKRPLIVGASINSIQKRFEYATLDHVPVPGLSIDGWYLELSTPTSSLDKGFRVTRWTKSEIEAELSGEFFQVYATRNDPTCTPPMDAPMEKRCYVAVEKKLPFKLKIAAKLKE